MATYTELLNTLQADSYTNGWGAIAAFDGATIMPMLSDYYASMIHGVDAGRPIAKDPETIYFLSNDELFATVQSFVFAAPQVSLGTGSLDDPKVLLTYELTRGVYSERTKLPGRPEKIVHLINLAAGRRHTLTVELDLADAIGRIDDQGTARLTLGAASNPLCSLGSTDVAKRAVGERLLEILSARQIGPATLVLGSLMPERKFLRPTTFKLRPQAGPVGTAGALLALIAKPDGALGQSLRQDDFPYLIPEGRDSAGKPYSATLLVSRDYPALRDGEAEQIFGQLLFPNENYFKASSTHHDTQDTVLFGSIALPAQAPAGKAVRNEPGIATQLLTLSAGASASPVSLCASSSNAMGWNWELPQPALGTLDAQAGADAVYTPPASLPGEASVLLQRVIATNRGTGEHYEACFVLQASYHPVAQFDPTLLSDMSFSTPITLAHDFDVEDYREEWSVVGRGTAARSGPGKVSYASPLPGGDDIELVVCRIFLQRANGDERLVGYGYVIVQLGEVVPTRKWANLDPFKIRAKQVGAVPYANGLQQFEIEVEIGTGTNEPDITDAEFATLRLAIRGGADIPLIPRTLEGLVPDAEGVTAQWGYKLEANGYRLASNTNGPTGEGQPRGNTRFKTFYLHTTAGSPATFIARITSADDITYDSTSNGEGEGQERALTVLRRNPEVWTQDLARIPRQRVDGGFLDLGVPPDPNYTVDFPHYGWHLRTCDYWTLEQQVNTLPVRIVRLQIHSDGPPIKWESEQNDEDLFSYIGVALIKDASTHRGLQFASVVYEPVLYLPKEFNGVPQHSLIKHGSAPGPGRLLLSVNRVMDVFYRQRAQIKETLGAFDFEQPTVLSLWDEDGNCHKLQVSFEELNRDKLQVRQI